MEKNNKKILITAGATREHIDPVRFISNCSTGTMGYSIAAKAREKGFQTCLISGPTALDKPNNVEFVSVMTAREMRDEVIRRADEYDCLIMAAAVCDFRPASESPDKIKKKDGLTLELVKNPDILVEISQRTDLIKVGFALETGELVKNATDKLKNKKLDLIIANSIDENNDPFGTGAKGYTMIDKEGGITDIKEVTKDAMAEIMIDKIGELL